MSLSCFKAYDVRGRVPEELDEDLAWRIGHAFALEIDPGRVVLGRDIRLESPMLATALAEGLMDGGVDVIDIGLCGTEEIYFNAFHREAVGVGGGIMVTASHNPKGYNGLKLVRRGARPISGDSGLFAIRDRAEGLKRRTEQTARGRLIRDEDKTAYIDHILGYIDPAKLKPLKILANPGNGAAGPVVRLLAERLPFALTLIDETPDGNFPHGVPNPLLPEMRQATAEAVRRERADLGVAWDGDFDRCFLFDETGAFIEGYYLVGLLAERLLAGAPGEKIIHDPRLTWNTIDVVQKAGGVPVQSKTGHAFIKERMRAEGALYGGEMSAHHYFRDFAFCDSGMIPWLLIAELMSVTGRGLKDLVGGRAALFPCSGEINYQVEDVPATLARVERHYTDLARGINHTDGVSVDLGDWRFNLRGSNTEPLLRLNVETRGDAEAVARHVAAIERLIQGR